MSQTGSPDSIPTTQFEQTIQGMISFQQALPLYLAQKMDSAQILPLLMKKHKLSTKSVYCTTQEKKLTTEQYTQYYSKIVKKLHSPREMVYFVDYYGRSLRCLEPIETMAPSAVPSYKQNCEKERPYVIKSGYFSPFVICICGDGRVLKPLVSTPTTISSQIKIAFGTKVVINETDADELPVSDDVLTKYYTEVIFDDIQKKRRKEGGSLELQSEVDKAYLVVNSSLRGLVSVKDSKQQKVSIVSLQDALFRMAPISFFEDLIDSIVLHDLVLNQSAQVLSVLSRILEIKPQTVLKCFLGVLYKRCEGNEIVEENEFVTSVERTYKRIYEIPKLVTDVWKKENIEMNVEEMAYPLNVMFVNLFNTSAFAQCKSANEMSLFVQLNYPALAQHFKLERRRTSF
ncbi:hypothetical protein EIN_087430 [Entamoeba invadens IP1]|uniref:hypothetical protein n=1 Tax=Entamoeba invadens IP1 TaxID=370355 RepID=UPI0002C3FB9D|nr:hypothetical protein EIN_087430 [Entamoeba invadens IP1]ELP85431.1 hypothetical protein EIN_087430 [Entamoeba invadens IP1]|eukprot:XP_004184777.1 hypothetical protein EIN_087430 [Entamoeba invadens IP1]